MMNNNHLYASAQATQVKLKMIKRFKLVVYFYLFSEIVFLMIGGSFIIFDIKDTYRDILIILEEIIDIIGLFGICLIFFAKNRGQYFNLPEFDHRHQAREATPMYEIGSLNECQSFMIGERPMIVQQPLEDKSQIINTYSMYMIALPLKPISRRNNSGDLRASLLRPGLQMS